MRRIIAGRKRSSCGCNRRGWQIAFLWKKNASDTNVLLPIHRIKHFRIKLAHNCYHECLVRIMLHGHFSYVKTRSKLVDFCFDFLTCDITVPPISHVVILLWNIFDSVVRLEYITRADSASVSRISRFERDFCCFTREWRHRIDRFITNCCARNIRVRSSRRSIETIILLFYLLLMGFLEWLVLNSHSSSASSTT